MNHTLQPVLCCGEGSSSDIAVFLSSCGSTYEVYVGVALLERVGSDPECLARKLLVGRLRNAGLSLRQLHDQFGHCPCTIRKWAAALLSGDIDRIARAFSGRSGKRKITPELIRYARQLYRERHLLGRNYREAIIGKILEVFGVRISTATASALFASEPEGGNGGGGCPDSTIALQPEPATSSPAEPSVKQSCTPLPAQCAAGGAGIQLIHHAGQVLFTAEMKGIGDPFQRQLVGQLLQGAVNVEQSKTLCGRSLAHFTGPIVKGLKEQRDALDAMASGEQVLEAYRRNALLLCDGPNRGNLFYFDPHTKEYTGQLKVLKGWCGRRHGVTATVNLDAFHTRSGRPCFIGHYSPYYDMRERFFMSLQLFDLLFEPHRRRNRIFVIDRGIFGLETLRAFVGDYIITWEKGYSQDGWQESLPATVFTRSIPKNRSADLRWTVFQCQDAPWQRDGSFRRIVVRATTEGGAQAEVAILTSHPELDVQDVVWPIFRRWLQENDFKYLDTHFGLNQLTSRDSFRFADRADQFEDRPVDDPQYRELKAERNSLESKLGKRLLQIRKAEKQSAELAIRKARLEAQAAEAGQQQSETLSRSIRQMQRKLRQAARKQEKLRNERDSIENELGPLEAQLCDALRKQSRLQLLIDRNYHLLDTRKKAMMDALRITAANIFRNVQDQFRAICDNFRDDHVHVRMISRCSGTIENRLDKVVLQIWLPGTLQPHRISAIEQLLESIQRATNEKIPAPKPIQIKLIAGPLRFHASTQDSTLVLTDR